MKALGVIFPLITNKYRLEEVGKEVYVQNWSYPPKTQNVVVVVAERKFSSMDFLLTFVRFFYCLMMKESGLRLGFRDFFENSNYDGFAPKLMGPVGLLVLLNRSSDLFQTWLVVFLTL